MTLPHLRSGWLAGLEIAAGVAAVAVAEADGLWWVTLVCGGLLGLLVRGWRSVVGALLVGALGWGIPLLWRARTEPVGAVAEVLGGLLGVPGAVALAITLLVGVLLALAGAWVGITTRRVLSHEPGEPPPSSTSDGSQS